MESNSHHNLPPEYQLKKTLTANIGVVYFYDHVVIFEAYEGVTVSYKTGFSLLLKGLNYLGTRPWVYVTNRIHSYSLKPVDYKYLNNVTTLKAMAVVNRNEVAMLNAELESKFCKKPFKVFDNLLEAVIWAKGHL